MRLFWIFPLFLCAKMFAQHEILVKVLNVPSFEGKISVALYDKERSFLKFYEAHTYASTTAVIGETRVLLRNIPNGHYAVALFYDKNGNGELDMNWMGIPKEKVGFSNAKMKFFGPPSFEECAFDLKGDAILSIRL